MGKYLLLVLLGCFLGACQNDAPVDEPKEIEEEVIPALEKDRTYKKREDVKLSEKEIALSKSQYDFSFSLFENYEHSLKSTGENKENFAISPFSAHQFLSMVANGLNDETLSNLVDVLIPGSSSIEDLNKYNSHIADALWDVDNLSDVVISNSLWTDPGYNVREEYAKSIREWYDAEALITELSKTDGMEEINKWVKKKTYGLIPKLLNRPPCVHGTLLNTLYFKAPWSTSSYGVTDDLFKNLDGSSSEIEFIASNDFAKIYEDEVYSVLSLEFGNQAFRFNVILPADEPKSMAYVNPEDWGKISANLQKEEIEFYLPKFNVKNNSDIYKAISEMGLSEILKGNNLTKISPDIDGFNSVIHSVNLEIDEKGCEGAAATIGGWVTEGGGGGMRQPKVFKADRPFMFILDEVSTGTILFMGRINKL